jgi:hypothetical protein
LHIGGCGGGSLVGHCGQRRRQGDAEGGQ